MKVIFLDIDGVLNHNGCRNLEMGYYFVEDDLILNLKKIVDDTGAKVVLSSTWREGWNDLRYGINTIEARLFKKLNHKLSNYGITFISKTPMLESDYRGEEVDLWFHNWKGEQIDSFVILDDDDDMKPYMDYLVRTNPNIGLTDADCKVAINILNERKYND